MLAIGFCEKILNYFPLRLDQHFDLRNQVELVKNFQCGKYEL